MAELINLNRVRKNKKRVEKEVKADENRARFGMTKAEKQKLRAKSKIADRTLDGHKREDSE